jgi:hypothetical protein
VDDRERALDFFGSVDTSDGCGLDSADVDRLAAEFAAVRREEREACAKACEASHGPARYTEEQESHYQACQKCAAAIRAMKEVARG